MTDMRMRVYRYLPAKLFGFVRDEAGSGIVVYFHLGDFDPGKFESNPLSCSDCTGCAWSQTNPSPVPGEWVRVRVPFDPDNPPEPTAKAPRAGRVFRTGAPVCVRGQVESFDARRGYGFIHGEDGVSYHLHRSEVIGGRLPIPGDVARFFSGTREGKPRACYVNFCR